MSTTHAQRERVLAYYDGLCRWIKPAVELVSSEADSALASGRKIFDDMIDELPYVDRPEHTMAGSMFACAAMLAVFEVLRDRETDAHAWGRVVCTLPAAAPQEDEDARERLRADAAASQSGAAANEFEFELVDADEHVDRGMNIKSCAICHLFAKHDAMELVPYMCAFDDVMSAAGDQGLRRTGTIALGARQCDFRFQQGGKPLPLAEQYPDRIRLKDA